MVKFEDFQDIINLIIFSIIVVVFAIGLPLLAITLGRGGEEQQNIELFEIMGVLFIIGLVLALLLKIGELIMKRFKSKKGAYRKFGWIGTVLHDPENGLLTNIKENGFETKGEIIFPFRWIANPLKLLAVSIPLFAIISLVQLFRDSLFTSLPTITFQQISEFGAGILAVEPSGIGEIIIPLTLLGLFIKAMFHLENIGTLPKGFKWIPIMLSPWAYGAIWMGMHGLLHPDSQIALQFVYFFGVISAYLVVFTGSIIPAWMFKDNNNLFGFLEESIKSNQEILGLSVAVITVYVIVVALVWFLSSKIGKKKESE